jgi:phage-related protein
MSDVVVDVVASGAWKVGAWCHRGENVIDECGLEAAAYDALIAMLDRIASHSEGHTILPTNRDHLVQSKPAQIRQISWAGTWRAAYIVDGTAVVVLLLHLYRKKGGKSGKTDQDDIDKAERRRQTYETAKTEGRITWRDQT